MPNNKLDEKFWFKYFRVYDVLNKLIPYKKTLYDISSKVVGDNLVVLDLGCGTGNLIKILSNNKNIKKIYGIDYSEVALDIAKNKNTQLVNFSKVDINEKIPFNDQYFDFVVMNNVLYTINPKNRLSLLNEIYRILKPGGIFIVSSINNNFKPINIYKDHIKQSIKEKGYLSTFMDIILFIKPTILIFYYNFLIKKENKTGNYSFMKVNEQGSLLNKTGFKNVHDNILTYSDNAYLTWGIK